MRSVATATIVSAADSGYFGLLRGLVLSLKRHQQTASLPISILDLGLTEGEQAWLHSHGATLKVPGWDVDFPGRERVPPHFRAMVARPYLPRHFPGHEIYLWLDADTWVQDGTAIDLFVTAAASGKLAIVPELDRGYWTIHKPPKLWGQNQKAFAWAFGMRAGYRLGRHPILNCGAFALRADAPHWRLWAEAHRHALTRRGLRRPPGPHNFGFFLSEQTAINYAVFADRAPVDLLPAYCNWFCGKGTPMYDAERRLLVEPHTPHQPLGVVHLAGAGMKDRTWELATPAGHRVATRLTFDALHREDSQAADEPAAALPEAAAE